MENILHSNNNQVKEVDLFIIDKRSGENLNLYEDIVKNLGKEIFFEDNNVIAYGRKNENNEYSDAAEPPVRCGVSHW